MDADSCRESLATLLSQEASSLDELAVLLDREHGLLVANDVNTLGQAMEERQVTIGRLLRIEDERRALCRMHGKETNTGGLEKLLAWCDPYGTLKGRWADCAKGATRCRDLNDKNGALVNARMKRVQNVLGVLTGKTAESPTYGPKGAYSMPRAGNVVTTEA
ncbi:MAG: flagellar protein FlgN [Gammaproteobacteria bacterium]